MSVSTDWVNYLIKSYKLCVQPHQVTSLRHLTDHERDEGGVTLPLLPSQRSLGQQHAGVDGIFNCTEQKRGSLKHLNVVEEFKEKVHLRPKTHCGGRIWCDSSSWRNTGWQGPSSSRRTVQLQPSANIKNIFFLKFITKLKKSHNIYLVNGLD